MKEAGAFRVAELMGEPVIAHDDKLLLRAQKSDIGLTPRSEWHSATNIQHRDGEAIIVSYHKANPQDSKKPFTIGPKEYDRLTPEDRAGWYPQPLRGLELAPGVKVTFRDNRMDLLMANLFENADSRYRKGLEYLLDLTEQGVLAYTPRAGDSPRNRREAVRNRMKRYVKPSEYEHDLLFSGSLGAAIMADLEKHDIAPEHFPGTAYLQGHKLYPELRKSVKVYDIGHREGAGDGRYVKLETTLRKAFFKAEGLSVADLTEQPKIQERVCAELVESVSKTINLCSDRTLTMIAEALNVPMGARRQAPRMLAEAMLVRERTYTDRLEALERDMREVKRAQAEHDRRIARLERERE